MEKKEYDKLHVEEKDWYFFSRRMFFSAILEKFIPKNAGLRILDLGCGSGQMFKILGKYGRVVGIEPSLYALNFAPKSAFKVCGVGTKIPFKDKSFGMITAYGVLEHIEDDNTTLREINRVLNKGGSLMVEVPAYQFLWSLHDEALHHKRRYTEKSLVKKMESAGFVVKKSGYFFGAILPAVIILRMFKKVFGNDEVKTDSFEKIPEWVKNALINMHKLESLFAKQFYMPFGVSVFVFAEKKI